MSQLSHVTVTATSELQKCDIVNMSMDAAPLPSLPLPLLLPQGVADGAGCWAMCALSRKCRGAGASTKEDMSFVTGTVDAIIGGAHGYCDSHHASNHPHSHPPYNPGSLSYREAYEQIKARRRERLGQRRYNDDTENSCHNNPKPLFHLPLLFLLIFALNLPS